MRSILVSLVILLFTSTFVRAADGPPDQSALVAGNTQFGLELYKSLRTQEGNLFLSPYSISSALAMTYGGARGRTAEEMARVLHFELPADRLHPAFGALIREINSEPVAKRGYELSTANALWGQKSYPFHPAFLKLIGDDYGAGLRQVDFSADRGGPQDHQRLGRERDTRQDQGTAQAGHPHRQHATRVDQRNLLQGHLGRSIQEGSHPQRRFPHRSRQERHHPAHGPEGRLQLRRRRGPAAAGTPVRRQGDLRWSYCCRRRRTASPTSRGSYRRRTWPPGWPGCASPRSTSPCRGSR